MTPKFVIMTGTIPSAKVGQFKRGVTGVPFDRQRDEADLPGSFTVGEFFFCNTTGEGHDFDLHRIFDLTFAALMC